MKTVATIERNLARVDACPGNSKDAHAFGKNRSTRLDAVLTVADQHCPRQAAQAAKCDKRLHNDLF